MHVLPLEPQQKKTQKSSLTAKKFDRRSRGNLESKVKISSKGFPAKKLKASKPKTIKSATTATASPKTKKAERESKLFLSSSPLVGWFYRDVVLT